MQTPFTNAKDMSVEMTHRGTTPEYLYTQIESKIMSKTFSVATTWDMRNGAELKFITVNPWKNVDANVKYSGE